MGEHRQPASCSVECSTPWFDLVSKRVADGDLPYYALRMLDYVSVVALTATREMILVRQYRPAVEQYTLELPAGHVEKDQTPEEAARRELTEETGFTPPRLDFLGTLLSDTGRNENKMWCYLASDVQPPSPSWVREEGIEVVLVPLDRIHDLIRGGEFNHALHVAALMMATLRSPAFTRWSGPATAR